MSFNKCKKTFILSKILLEEEVSFCLRGHQEKALTKLTLCNLVKDKKMNCI